MRHLFLPLSLFLAAVLTDIRIHTIPDKAFSGLGGDPERLWNMEVQWNAAHSFSVRVFRSEEAAREAQRRFLERFADPNVYFYCTMFYVEGKVPGLRSPWPCMDQDASMPFGHRRVQHDCRQSQRSCTAVLPRSAGRVRQRATSGH